jgi:hypothetical protein
MRVIPQEERRPIEDVMKKSVQMNDDSKQLPTPFESPSSQH